MLKNLNKISLIVFGTVVVISLFSGCSGTGNNPTTVVNSPIKNMNVTTGGLTTQSTVKTFTKTELSKYNGENGNPSYVAVNGKVYDVSNAKGWRSGKHQGYQAGVDMSDIIKDSPHGVGVVDGLPLVGILVK